jgi:hypothetical protein
MSSEHRCGPQSLALTAILRGCVKYSIVITKEGQRRLHKFSSKMPHASADDAADTLQREKAWPKQRGPSANRQPHLQHRTPWAVALAACVLRTDMIDGKTGAAPSPQTASLHLSSQREAAFHLWSLLLVERAG